MSSGSGPTIPGGPGVPEEPREGDGASSPEDAPVRNATTLPPTQVVVVPSVGPAFRPRPGEAEFRPRVTPMPADTPPPAGARIAVGHAAEGAPVDEEASPADAEPSGWSSAVAPAALPPRGVTPAPLSPSPSLRVVPGRYAGAPPPEPAPPPPAPEPRVRGSLSVMASPTTLQAARDTRFGEGLAAGRRSMVTPAYRQPAAPLPKRGGASRAADAPIAQDLFRDGSFDELEGAIPPFDDHPAQVMEDVGQPYTTGYTVADPPPIPGIADRFTPPAALPTELGSRRVRADVGGTPGPDRKERFEPTPAPSRRVAPRLVAASPSTNVPAVEAKPSPSWFWVGVSGIGVGLVGLFALAGAVVLVYGGPAKSEDEGPAGLVQSAPRPVEPAPEPQARASSAPAAPTTTGTLKVRANRRALVYVDDKVMTYTPLSLDLPPGAHAVSAMMPGQPNSRQSREVNVPKPGETVSIEFTF